jgi:hypothetical protein
MPGPSGPRGLARATHDPWGVPPWADRMIGGARSPPVGSTNFLVRCALALQLAFLVAVVAALAVTTAETAVGVRSLAVVLVTPIVGLALICLFLSWRRSPWGFGGAAALGAVGIGVRLVVSTQPRLEVGGGLPTWVTALYVVLGASVALTSLATAFQLRPPSLPK